MSKIFVPAVLLVALVASTASAQSFGYPSYGNVNYEGIRAWPVRHNVRAMESMRGMSTGGPVYVDDSAMVSPVQSHGDLKGYPFVSGCCEEKSACCNGLWDGFCGGRKLGHSMRGWMHSCQTCDVAPCGKGGHGLRLHRAHKGGCGCGVPACGGCARGSWCGVGGLGGCNTGCGVGYGRIGLFDWFHHRHGAGCGCDSCSLGGHGKGGFVKGGCSSCGGAVQHGSHMQHGDYYSPVPMSEPSTIEPSQPGEEVGPSNLPSPAVEAPPAPTSAPAENSARINHSTWRWLPASYYQNGQ